MESVTWRNLFRIREKTICLVLKVCGKLYFPHRKRDFECWVSVLRVHLCVSICQDGHSSCGVLGTAVCERGSQHKVTSVTGATAVATSS